MKGGMTCGLLCGQRRLTESDKIQIIFAGVMVVMGTHRVQCNRDCHKRRHRSQKLSLELKVDNNIFITRYTRAIMASCNRQRYQSKAKNLFGISV